MNDILKKLVENEILTEENKKELTESIQTAVNEAVTAAKAEADATVRRELTEQYLNDFNKLVEALDTKVEEQLRAELGELRESIENFRDLETEYAERLVEAKKEMASELKEDLSNLVDALDSFLTEALEAELTELKESIEDAKKLGFGKKLFEAFTNEYKDQFANDDELYHSLNESQAELQETKTVLADAKRELAQVKRDQKMTTLLQDLNGRPREIMEALLKNTPLDKLDEAYTKYIGRVITETVENKTNTKQKDTDAKSGVLAESVKGDNAKNKVVNGNTEKLLESLDNLEKKMTAEEAAWLKKVSGIE